MEINNEDEVERRKEEDFQQEANLERLKYIQSLYRQGLTEEQVNKNLDNRTNLNCEFAQRPAEKIHDYHYKMAQQYSGQYGAKSDW